MATIDLLKVCTGCDRQLSIAQFSCDRSKIDGLQTRCKECRSAKDRNYYIANNTKIIARSAAAYEADKPRHRQRATSWAAVNPDKVVLSREKWRAANRDIEREAARIAQAEMLRNAPARRLNRAMSRAVWGTFRRKKQGRRWCEVVGYTQSELIAHLERQFLPGMSWSNYGAWHVDHKRPIVSFDFTSSEDEDFKVCWSLGNLRPLWAKDNLRKNRRWSPEITGQLPTVTPSKLLLEKSSPASG